MAITANYIKPTERLEIIRFDVTRDNFEFFFGVIYETIFCFRERSGAVKMLKLCIIDLEKQVMN